MTGEPMTDAELGAIRARVGDHLARSAADGFPLPAVVADPIIPLLAEVDRLRAANERLAPLAAMNVEANEIEGHISNAELRELDRLRAHGLTWADVDALLATAYFLDEDDAVDADKADDKLPRHMSACVMIADKIAALLPPRDPTPAGTT